MNRWSYAARLREPSTWAAFAVLASFFGGHFADPGIQQGIVTTGVTLGGILGMFLGEKNRD